jgi:transposase
VRVLALHPNQVKAARDRFRASGGKSDRFDSFVLCELARTDAHRFRVLEPDSDQTKAVRALTRSREDLVAARVALANQLRAELERFWPGQA